MDDWVEISVESLGSPSEGLVFNMLSRGPSTGNPKGFPQAVLCKFQGRWFAGLLAGQSDSPTDEFNLLLELGIFAQEPLHLSNGVHHGGVISSTKLLA